MTSVMKRSCYTTLPATSHKCKQKTETESGGMRHLLAWLCDVLASIHAPMWCYIGQ